MTAESIPPTSPPRRSWRVPVTIALVLVGLWLLTRIAAPAGGLLGEVRRIAAVMSLINRRYVDRPDLSRLTRGAVEGMLRQLDPHSVYIPAKEQEQFAENDAGRFEGIGISFVIQNELITVVAPIPGSPADLVGLRAGDRIVEIDGVSAYGISNDEVFRRLRGPKGSVVSVRVLRDGIVQPLDFTIIRDRIPIHSVLTSFLLADTVGYVLLNQFTSTTTPELAEVLNRLEAQGMTSLVLDLRNNQGGRLSEAVAVCDMFIPGGQVLVRQIGRDDVVEMEYVSTDKATRPLCDLVVLVNSGSASASEIVAAAVQDLDRGVVVGQPTFGKGLVQSPFQLDDGSVIRLSTARWLTPAGRSLQRPYDRGLADYYEHSGEPDTVADTLRRAFRTRKGRTVYDHGGVQPDVPVDERLISATTARMVSARLPLEFAPEVIRRHQLTADMTFPVFRKQFNPSNDDLHAMAALAVKKGIEMSSAAWETDREYLANLLKAEVAQILWNNRDYYYIIRSDDDPVIQAALKVLTQAREMAMDWRPTEKGLTSSALNQ